MVTENKNFLQQTNFKITIDRKHYGNLEYFIQGVMHPAVALPYVEVPYKRVNVSMEGDKMEFSEVTFSMIMDEGMTAYGEMYEWMKRIIQENIRPPSDRTSESPPTRADITLSILSSHNNEVRRIRYIDCMPINLGDINLEATVGDTQPIIVPITFKYTYFELE